MMKKELLNQNNVTVGNDVVKGSKKAIVSLAIVSAIMATGVVGLLAKTYASNDVRPYSQSYVDSSIKVEKVSNTNQKNDAETLITDRVSLYSCEVEGNKATFLVNTGDKEMQATRLDVKEDNGIIKVNAYAAPITKGAAVDTLYEFEEEFKDIKQIYFADSLIYENGTDIASFVADVYSLKIDSVNDLKGLKRLEDEIGLFGSTYNVTSSEVVDGTIKYTAFEHEESQCTEQEMKEKAYFLFASVADLDKIEWNYESNGEMKQFILTVEDASSELDMDIKACGETASKMQEIYDELYVEIK